MAKRARDPKAVVDRAQQEFGDRLRQARLLKGFKKGRHLAKKLGINDNTYYRYERGESMPNLETIRRICECLEVDIAALLPYGPPSEEPSVPRQPSGFAESSVSDLPQIESSLLDRVSRNSIDAERVAPSPASAGSNADVALDIDRARCAMLAWDLASVLAARHAKALGYSDATADANPKPTQASIYLQLKTDPFGTISRLYTKLPRRARGALPREVEELAESYLSAYRSYLNTQLSRTS